MFSRNDFFFKSKAFAIRPDVTKRKAFRFSAWRWLLAFFLLSVNLALAAESAPKQHLIVGSELDFPPFALVREGGVADGFTAELWQAVAREAHLDATIRTGPFHQILQQFKSGQVDVLINLALSDERRRFAEFAVSHVKMAGAIFTRKSESRIKSEDDLTGKSLIVLNADLAHDYALMHGWTDLTLVDTVASGMKLLASSTRHDAMLVGRLVGLNTTKELKLDNVQVLQLKLGFHQDFAFAVRKGNADLLARINDALVSVRASGAYDAIYAKWFAGLEPQLLSMESILKYLIPALWVILLLAIALLRERSLRVRWKSTATDLDASITERKQVEMALRESEERFKAFMDRSPAIAFIKDDNGRYVYVNKTWEDIYALDWRGKTDAELWPGENAVMFSESDRRAVEAGQASESFETVLDKDGRSQDWWVMKFPIVDADDKRMLGGMALDITDRKQAEETLRRRERQLVEAERMGQMGSWELNLVSNRLEWSDEIFRIFEIDPTQFGASYEAFLNAVHPEDREAVNLAYSDSVRDRTPYEITHRLLMAGGRVKWMHERGETFYDAAGRALRTVGSVHDITESKRVEEALRAAHDELERRVEERTAELTRSNALLREKDEYLTLAQRAAHTGLWGRDLTTGKASMSPEWHDLMGFPLVEGPVSYAEFLDRIHSDDRARVNEMSLHQENSDFANEFRILHPIKGERWILSQGWRGITTADGHFHMLGALIDITARKRSEELLRKNQEWLNQAVIVANLGVFEHDFITDELAFSEAFRRMLDWPEELTPSSSEFQRRLHPDDREPVRSAIREAHASMDGRLALEYRVVRQDGSIGWLLVRSQLFFDGAGPTRRLIRGVGAALDITERKRAEEKLTEAKDLLQKVMDSCPDWIFAKDLDHRFLFANRAFAEAQSLAPDDMIGKLDTEFWSEELCEGNPAKGIRGFHEDDRAAFRGEMVYNPADPATFGDGSVHIFDTYKSPMKDEAGRIFGVLCYGRDTTERKLAEEALRASEERLQHALAVGRMGTWERHLRTGTETWDKRTYEIFGVETGTPVDLDAFLSRIHPEDLPGVKSAVRRTESTGADYMCEYRVLKPDGQTIWIHANGGLRRDPNGTPSHIAGVNFDVTERKQAEEALRESEARLRAILDHNPAPVFIKNTAGRYVHVNNRFEDLFGLHGVNSVGKTDAELFAGEQAEAFQTNDRKVLALGHAIQFEEVTQYYDGEHTSIVTKFPLLDTDGKIYALCGIATDITERKRAEEALRKLTEDLDRRVVERTQELADSRARLRALVGEITKTEERERRRLAVELHDYLAQMLTVSRLSIGRAGKLAADDALKQRLAEAQQSVDDSIAYTRSLMAQLSPRVLYDLGLPAAITWLAAQQKERHGLIVEIDGESEGFALDEERSVLAFQCVRELLWNIVKHAETNQALVSYAIQDGELTVEVADEGRGFDPEILHGYGSGMEKFGLFSIRERLEIFGGKLEVTSRPGQGTRVRITLPAPQSEIAPMVTQGVPPVRAALAAGKRLSVALVDDHAVVRRGLRQALEEFADLTVVGEAKDGLEGVELAREFRPDVVVMDVNMPRMNGIEATKLIRQEMPSTIVVGLSFDSGAQVTQAMQAAGAFTCVTKERAVEDIHQAILDAVEERRTLKMENGELRMDNGR